MNSILKISVTVIQLLASLQKVPYYRLVYSVWCSPLPTPPPPTPYNNPPPHPNKPEISATVSHIVILFIVFCGIIRWHFAQIRSWRSYTSLNMISHKTIFCTDPHTDLNRLSLGDFFVSVCLRPYLLHELTKRAPKQDNVYAFREQEDIKLL